MNRLYYGDNLDILRRYVSDVNVIKTHIRHLREKISSLPHSPQPLRTLPGVGYVINQTDEHGQILQE